MKTFGQLCEDRGEKAYKQAIGMGLKYGGFGYWKDPQTNETVYKTENDTLVPVEPKEESELADKKGPGDPASERGEGGPGGGPGGGMANAAGMLQMPGAGGIAGQGIQGAPLPGQEQVPKENEWEPGPDGDTCVGDDAEEPAEVEKDSFVGRTNFLKWTAGPDGDNMTTVNPGMVGEQIISEGERTELGSDYVSLNTKQKKFHSDRLKSAANQKSSTPAKSMGLSTLNKLIGDNPEPTPQPKKQANPAQQKKSKEMASNMNKTFGDLGIASDPSYDLDDTYENGIELGEGIQGRVMKDKDKMVVVKKGAIGAHELEALHRMKDHPGFPSVVNARFDAPFANQDPLRNNPSANERKERAYVDDERREKFYNDNAYGTNFYTKFPGAPGLFAMTAAEGEELAGVPFDDEDEQLHNMTTKMHQLRRDMHKQGIAHNDMHDGNVYYDQNNDQMSMLDFGLAHVSPIRALMEGLGGINGASMMDIMNDRAGTDEKGDYQLSDQFKGHNMRESSYDETREMGEMFDENVDNIRQKLLDDYDYETQNLEEDDYRDKVEKFLRGGIRMNKDEVRDTINDLSYIAPELGNDEDGGEFGADDYRPDDRRVMELIDMLYDGLEDTPLAKGATLSQRMARGYDDMEKQIGNDESDMIRAANSLRKSRKEKPISVKGLDLEKKGPKERRIPAQKRVFDKLTDHDD